MAEPLAEPSNSQWQNDGLPSPSPIPSPIPMPNPIPSKIQGTGGKPLFVKPTLQDVELQFSKIGVPTTEAEGFMAYYNSNGWKVSKNSMKCWVSACTTWKRNWVSRNSSLSPSGQKPDWLVRKDLEEAIANHPCNEKGTRYDPDSVDTDKWNEYVILIGKLEKLKNL